MAQNTTIKMTTRNVEMDVIKGVAILLVVFGHVISSESIMFRYLNNFHMPAFFFISGYFAYKSFLKSDITSLLSKKVRRLLIPFICISVLAVLFNIIFDLINGSGLNIFKYLSSSLLYAKSAWLLITLFFTFILQSIMLWLAKKKCGWLIIPLILAVYLLLPNDILNMGKLKVMLPFFELGYFFYKDEKIREFFNSKKIILFCMAVLYIVLLAIFFNYDKYINYSYFDYGFSNVISEIINYVYYTFISICGLALAFSLIPIIIKFLHLTDAMSDLGKYSMDVYIIHPFFIKALSLVGSLMFFQYGGLELLIQAVCALLITIICWQVAKRLLYKIKLYRVLFVGTK